jgi:hypothetical protein
MTYSPQAGWPGRVAVGVVRGDPPVVFLAESEPVLGRLAATELIASTAPDLLSVAGVLEAVRSALLEQRWADCIALWMQATGEVFDGYPDEEIVTAEELDTRSPVEQINQLPAFRTP